jgi:hypothetical protein
MARKGRVLDAGRGRARRGTQAVAVAASEPRARDTLAAASDDAAGPDIAA